MINRENERLKLSFKNGIDSYGEGKEIIAFMHYPPISSKELLVASSYSNFLNL